MGSLFSQEESIVLRRGQVTLPTLGLGLLKCSDEEATKVISFALDTGYGLIDGGRLYGNDKGVREALKDRPRDSFCYLAKLRPDEHDKVEETLRDELDKVGLDYVDIFLINNPAGKNIIEVWNEMLRLRDAGLAKAVGVSNFGWKMLEGLKATGVELPEVNEIEVNVFNQQKEDVEWLKKEQIAVIAYAPLAKGEKFGTLGGATKEEEAGWMIRWLLDKGYAVVPKSSNTERIKSNFDNSRTPLSAEKTAELDEKDEKLVSYHHMVKYMTKPWDEVKYGPALKDIADVFKD